MFLPGRSIFKPCDVVSSRQKSHGSWERLRTHWSICIWTSLPSTGPETETLLNPVTISITLRSQLPKGLFWFKSLWRQYPLIVVHAPILTTGTTFSMVPTILLLPGAVLSMHPPRPQKALSKEMFLSQSPSWDFRSSSRKRRRRPKHSGECWSKRDVP